MNRAWVVVGGFAAGLVIFGGWALGRNALSDSTLSTQAKQATSPPAATDATFRDRISGVSLRYPSTWQSRPTGASNAPLLVVAPDGSTSLLVRVTDTGLEKVTPKTLPIVRRYTDKLVKADPSVKLLGPPTPVEQGGLPGYRYRYTYAKRAGAHDHYFFFKQGRLISLAFQVTPARALSAHEAQFERIEHTLRGNGPA